MVWSFEQEKNIPIGTSRNIFYEPERGSGRCGIIGVYDKTKTEHLNSMVDDAREFTESEGSPLGD